MIEKWDKKLKESLWEINIMAMYLKLWEDVMNKVFQ
jgi:hypothetical protein